MQLIGTNCDLPLRNKISNFFFRAVFFLCNYSHFLSNDTFSGSIHLCCIFSHKSYFLLLYLSCLQNNRHLEVNISFPFPHHIKEKAKMNEFTLAFPCFISNKSRHLFSGTKIHSSPAKYKNASSIPKAGYVHHTFYISLRWHYPNQVTGLKHPLTLSPST